MAQKKNKNNHKKNFEERKKNDNFYLPEKTKRWIWGIVFFLFALVLIFSFFTLAGKVGEILRWGLISLIGKTIYILPLLLVITAIVFFATKYQDFFYSLILAILLLLLGLAGIFSSIYQTSRFADLPDGKILGGWIGYFLSLSLLKLFGFWVTQIIFAGAMLVGVIIFWHLLKQPSSPKEEGAEKEAKTSFIKKIFTPVFKVKEIEPETPLALEEATGKEVSDFPSHNLSSRFPLASQFKYEPPPFDLLEPDRGQPASGDTRTNSAIIKKTLQNFDISVEMSEINIGPTVTQYTLKPAEGVKLSKITGLSNDLSLALASHPIRIEAPIPGRSLVGVEMPNKVRARVRMRNLVENPNFQNAPSNLTIVLGRDVSGNPVYADLSKMPHLLVAGATGAGKTIFLNTLLLSLLYKNSPEIMRLILIDPKRVEFPVYQEIPHLLAPVIYNASFTFNALKWLTGEMERRFEVLAKAGSRDIAGFNEKISKNQDLREENGGPMPYIVVVVDELADLMAAKGKEIEAGIVRLAQMARAVGIHLVLATQRPSVEVITGLIKANVTSRISFQVASQVDSRTVLDMAGAEKLLGAGDMLHISAEIAKPKRIQAPYISEKEVKRVVNYIQTKIKSKEFSDEESSEAEVKKDILENGLREELKKTLETSETESETLFAGEDPLYEEAKKVVTEAKKASASLLQRRLRVGYARAARLLDILQEKGLVGPADGAKPREVFGEKEVGENEDPEGWQKV